MSAAIASATLDPTVYVARTVDAAASALVSLEHAEWVGFDVETAPAASQGSQRYRPGLDPYLSQIRLLQLSTPTEAYVLDTHAVSPELWLWWIQSHAPRIIAHNGRFDLSHLQHAGIFVPRVWDTMIADQLLRVGESGGSSLADVSERYLGRKLDKTLQTSDFGGDLSMDQLTYAARDAAILPLLHQALGPRLVKHGLKRAALLEFEAVPAFAMLSRSGFVLNQDRWSELTTKAEEDLARTEAELYKVLPSPAQQGTLFGEPERSLNLMSPAQVKASLALLGIHLESTNEHYLRSVDHPVTKLLLHHREVSQVLKMFLRPLPDQVHPITGRIHAEYWQMAAASGRTASSNPNMQQIPHAKEIRGCFGAAQNRALVIADYSQVELRIAAELSGDVKMIDAFRCGEDVHRQTAALVTGKAPQDVTKAERQLAKAVNFGIVYGMGAGGLVAYAHDTYGVSMTLEEATMFRTRYLDNYAGVAAWHWKQLSKARKQGGTRTLSGRWRPLPEPTVSSATNSPTQGTGADILKCALALIAPVAYRNSWNLVAEVHDEIAIEAPAHQAEEAKEALSKAMAEAGKRFLHRVPVEAEAKVVATWAEK